VIVIKKLFCCVLLYYEVCIVAKKREIFCMYKMLIRMKHYIKNTNERENYIMRYPN
jgi:hypothetical protein